MKIILGSESFSRQRVLEEYGFEFEILPSHLDEKSIRSNDFEELPLLIARAKTDNLLAKIKDESLLITSDQIVVCNGELREKPTSKKEAEQFLLSYSTYPAQTISAVVVTNTRTKRRAEGIDIATIYFRDIPVENIKQIIDEGYILKTAGGLVIEHPLISPFIKEIIGTQDSIRGMPMELTKKLMQNVM